MKAWHRTHALLASVVLAWPLGLGGCQAREVRPPVASDMKPDFMSLVSMAGAASSQTRGQQGGSVTGVSLDLRDEDPGSRENRSVRIRAVINGEAILDEEVVAAAFQQMVGARTEKEKAAILNAKLHEIIDREVVLQDAVARLGKRGNGKVIRDLQSFAQREFEKQWLNRMMYANKYTDVDAFKRFLKSNGMPLDMIRRQWERNFIAMEYMRSRIEPSLTRIGHLEVAEYYEKHPEAFKVEDSVVWQDIFIAKARHPTPEAARKFAGALLERIRRGEDFVRLCREHDNGDSSLRENAEGIGRKRGEIKPVEAESVLLGMKPGQAALIELEFGIHIMKVVSRDHAGRRPFDDKTQREIQDKLRQEIFAVEMKRMVNELKRRAIIQIANEVK